MLHAKQLGFSDQQIAKLTNSEFFEVRRYRKNLILFQFIKLLILVQLNSLPQLPIIIQLTKNLSLI